MTHILQIIQARQGRGKAKQRICAANASRGGLPNAKEAGEILGIAKCRDAIAKLDPDEKCPVKLDGIQGRGNPVRTVINEPGLYSLILRSNKPAAKKFKRCVTHEVKQGHVPALQAAISAHPQA